MRLAGWPAGESRVSVSPWDPFHSLIVAPSFGACNAAAGPALSARRHGGNCCPLHLDVADDIREEVPGLPGGSQWVARVRCQSEGGRVTSVEFGLSVSALEASASLIVPGSLAAGTPAGPGGASSTCDISSADISTTATSPASSAIEISCGGSTFSALLTQFTLLDRYKVIIIDIIRVLLYIFLYISYIQLYPSTVPIQL